MLVRVLVCGLCSCVCVCVRCRNTDDKHADIMSGHRAGKRWKKSNPHKVPAGYELVETGIAVRALRHGALWPMYCDRN